MPEAKAPKAKKAAKPAAHPPYANMIVAAIKALKDKKGSSRQAILLLTKVTVFFKLFPWTF